MMMHVWMRLQVFRCVSKGSSTHSGATRQARPLLLRGNAVAHRTDAIQQSHLSAAGSPVGFLLLQVKTIPNETIPKEAF